MQTIKNKITSLVLASVMLLTLIAGILPRTPIYAADGGTGGLQISSPKDGGEVNGYETIRVSWNKYTGVDHYILIVKDQNTNKEVFRDEDVGSSTKTYRIYSDDDVFTENGHEYKIYLAALDANGNVLNNGAAWNAIYVDNVLALDTPDITSHEKLSTHCTDEDLYVEWDPVDCATDYTIAAKKLNGEPKFNDNEAGTNITFSRTDNCQIKINKSKLEVGKYYKVALCATNTKQGVSSDWASVYILMEESGYLDVSDCDDLDSASGSTGSFWIYSNLDWSITCNKSWLSWTKNQKDDTHTEIVVKATSANTGTSNRKATFTISADGKDDVYVYVYQLAPEIEFPSFSNVSVTENVTLGEDITWSATVNGNGSLLETVTVGIYSKQNNDSVYLRNTNIGKETYVLNGLVTTGSVVSGYDASGNPKTLDMSSAGEYTVTFHASTDASTNNYAKTDPVTVTVTEPVGTGILGDVNSDGNVDNLDRFILNRYLNSMNGYTASMVNKESSDINGDGKITEEDCLILARHLFGWIGYEDMSVFYVGPTETPATDTSKWNMSFSSNAVTIEIELTGGTPDSSKNYLFIAEDSNGLHYSGIIDAGNTAASFSVKSLQMPRGEMYSYYVLPEGVALANNKEKYCIGKCAVPLFSGNMITSVKSAGRTVAKNGNVFLGDSVSIAWDGSYGVNNFRLVVTLNNAEILNKTFNHDGPGVETISAETISAIGPGTLIITGYVEPSAGSGLSTAVSTWNGNIIAFEDKNDIGIDPIALLNDNAKTLYNKGESKVYNQLQTYYYWQAFSDELTSGTHWGSKLEGIRADISNIVNGVFSSPTTFFFDTKPKALLKQAVKTKLLSEIENENSLFNSMSEQYESIISLLDSSIKGGVEGITAIYKSGQTIGGNNQNNIILLLSKKIDYRYVNTNDVDQILKVLNTTRVNYNGVSYNLSQFYNINSETALELKTMLGAVKKSRPDVQFDLIERTKESYVINIDKINATQNVGKTLKNIFKVAEYAGKFAVHINDMRSLYTLSEQFDEYEELMNEMVTSTDGIFNECIAELFAELRKDIYKQIVAETVIDCAKLVGDEAYDFIFLSLLEKNPYILLASVSNSIFTTLADTDTINKGELSIPYILEATNNTVSLISYKYYLFMMNPSNALYAEIESLFHTYKFQVELGAEIYLNISMANYNSYLNRFIRFVNPFDKDDRMPQDIQTCYDNDIKKLTNMMEDLGIK